MYLCVCICMCVGGQVTKDSLVSSSMMSEKLRLTSVQP